MTIINFPKIKKSELKNIFEKNCQRCSPFLEEEYRIGWGYGPSNAKIMVISAFPSRGSDTYMPWQGSRYTCIPFTSKVGLEYREQLLNMEIDIDNDVYFSHCIKCYFRSPPENALSNCAAYLRKEIAEIKPKIILLAGENTIRYFYRQLKIPDKIPSQIEIVVDGLLKAGDSYNIATLIHPKKIKRKLKKLHWDDLTYFSHTKEAIDECFQETINSSNQPEEES